MRDKPNIRDILENACKEFGLTMSEALAIMKTPLHPRELRDYFAAKAMPSILPLCQTYPYAAQECYAIADAMLKARDA